MRPVPVPISSRSRGATRGDDLERAPPRLRPRRHRASGCGASPPHSRGNTRRPSSARWRLIAASRCRSSAIVCVVARRTRPPDSGASRLPALARAEPIKYPTPLAEPVEQPGLAEQLQMARDARLALPEDLRQFGNGQLARGRTAPEPQPGRLGRGTQRRQKMLHRPGFSRDCMLQDMQICLCPQANFAAARCRDSAGVAA